MAAEPFVREASGQVFAEFAADYRRAGLAIIPTLGGDGKRPCVKGFNRYRQAPSAGAIQVWVNKFPSANIAAVAGLSGLTVVDIDDADLIGRCIERFGDTPLQTSTPSGGWHLFYRSSGEGNRNLRAEGLQVDIKGIGGIVLLPPSRNPETGNAYGFICGGLETFGNLPTINPGSLPTERQPSSDKVRVDKRLSDMVEGDGRNFALFGELLPIGARPDTSYEALLSQAQAINSDFHEPMDDSEVLGVVNSIWRYKEQGILIAPGERAAVVRHADYEVLRGDPDAAALWLDIVMEHQGRDHEFALDVQKMSARLGMSEARFRNARDGLTWKYGQIDRTREGGRGPGDPHRFRMARRRRLRVLK